MISLNELHNKITVTTSDAVYASETLTQKYIAVLTNILRIKQELPVGEEQGFRRVNTSNTELLKALQTILQDFLQELQAVKQNLNTSDEQIPLDEKNSANLNKILLMSVERAISRCIEAYGDKAKSFAVILQDLETLSGQMLKKMDFGERADLLLLQHEDGQTNEKKFAQRNIIRENEKLVYVRLFHKSMATLLLSSASKAWVKPLFESIKNAEKHGLAIYAKEEEVKKSLKGEGYGYVTLKINSQQDITQTRPVKLDPHLRCPILTIVNISTEHLIKFTYAGIDYPIVNGVIQLTPT